GLPAPTPPPAPSWPAAGSFVIYASSFKSPYGTTYENSTWSYGAGRWTQTCVEHYVPDPASPYGGTEDNATLVRLDASLPAGPLDVAAGDRVFVPMGGCDVWVTQTSQAQGKAGDTATRMG